MCSRVSLSHFLKNPMGQKPSSYNRTVTESCYKLPSCTSASKLLLCWWRHPLRSLDLDTFRRRSWQKRIRKTFLGQTRFLKGLVVFSLSSFFCSLCVSPPIFLRGKMWIRDLLVQSPPHSNWTTENRPIVLHCKRHGFATCMNWINEVALSLSTRNISELSSEWMWGVWKATHFMRAD